MAYNFLDIWNILVNEVAGSVTLFMILSLVVINYAAVKFRFPNVALIMIDAIFIIIISAYNNIILGFVLLIIGLFTGWQFKRMMEK